MFFDERTNVKRQASFDVGDVMIVYDAKMMFMTLYRWRKNDVVLSLEFVDDGPENNKFKMLKKKLIS